MNNDIVYVSTSSAYRVLKEVGLIPNQEYHKQKKPDEKIEINQPNKCGIPILFISLQKLIMPI
jgi:hypothetical protein